ncbi:MAG: 4'-phosphopantetheinyl transferase superfamily protein [Alicyclobacillus sp.]|nr:4'-phosphopantetheinyl transferase superfamily protein [Alicyclobacillus sp.]
MVNLVAVKWRPEEADRLQRAFLEFLSEDKQKRVSRCMHPMTRRQVLVADLFVRAVLGRHLNVTNRQLAFERNEYGKPSLRGISHVHYNVSHSHEWILCAVGTVEVGVDIQYMQPFDHRTVHRYLHPAEQEDIAGQDGAAQQLERFYAIWTRKESYVKALGRGLAEPFSSFCVAIGPREDSPLVDAVSRSPWRFTSCWVDAGYQATLCTPAAAHVDPVVQVWPMEAFEQMLVQMA